MSSATRCNANSCAIFIIAIQVMSCPNFSITDKLLTNLWIKICIQGYLSKGSPQGVTCFYKPDEMLITDSILLVKPVLYLIQISSLQMNFSSSYGINYMHRCT